MLTVGLMSRDRGIKRRLTAALLAVLAWASLVGAAWGQGEERTFDFNIREETLGAALDAIVKETKLVVLYPNELAQNRDVNPVIGHYTVREAIDELFRGTSFSGGLTENGVIYISLSGTETKDREADMNSGDIKKTLLAGAAAFLYGTGAYAQDVAVIEDGDDEACAEGDRACEKATRDTIVVTGTNIRGVQDLAAPTVVIDREDILSSGFTSTDQIFKSLPQNLSEISDSLPDGIYGFGVSNTAAGNAERATGVNLRGLGPEATLTLLNGVRRPGSVKGETVDVSGIPVSAIERVEVVTGGRSAIYGSDAVAGVVNIVMRRDFEGLETGASFGFTKHGGEKLGVNVVLGDKSDTGGYILIYDYQRDWLLDLVDTGFIVDGSDGIGNPITLPLQPEANRHSAFFAGHRSLGNRVELSADAFFSRKEYESYTESDLFGGKYFLDSDGGSENYGVSANALVGLGSDWAVKVSGSMGASEANRREKIAYTAFNFSSANAQGPDRTTLNTVSIIADGALPKISNITPRIAFGVERSVEQYGSLFSSSSGQELELTGDRSVKSAFAELFVPFVEAPQPGFQRLDLSAAARFDDYSDFGSTFNPQFGLVWEPIDGLSLRGSYSTSFRAPYITQASRAEAAREGGVGGLSVVLSPDPMAGGANTPVALLGGTDPNLGPAEAETWSIGSDWQPEFAPNTIISVSYFDVTFDGRIGQAKGGTPNSLLLTLEQDFLPVIDRNPTVSELEAVLTPVEGSAFIFNSTGGLPWTPDFNLPDWGLLAAFPNLVLFNNQTTNLAVSKVRGLDFRADTNFETGIGEVSFGVNGSYTLEHVRSLTATSPLISQLNSVGKPVDLRLRTNAGWRNGGWGAFVYVNYVRGYDNPLNDPSPTVSPWTTVDLTLSWDGSQTSKSGLFAGLRASVAVRNLLDQDPPTVAFSTFGTQWDSANADPYGRVVTFNVTKQW